MFMARCFRKPHNTFNLGEVGRWNRRRRSAGSASVRIDCRAPFLFRSSIVVMILFALPAQASMAQSPSDSAQAGSVGSRAASAHADVVVFVNSLTEDVATIGVAYNSKVPHAKVRSDLGRLLQSTGWGAARDLQITDASVHPDRLDRYPATTAAMVTLVHAAQVVRGAPQVLPYLVAFQAYNHIDVNFILDELTPYQGVEHVDNKALSVELFHTQQGVYRYEAIISDHQGPLPALVQVASPSLNQTGLPREVAQSARINTWSIVLMAAGAGLICCVCLYPFLLRRTHGHLTARAVPRR